MIRKVLYLKSVYSLIKEDVTKAGFKPMPFWKFLVFNYCNTFFNS